MSCCSSSVLIKNVAQHSLEPMRAVRATPPAHRPHTPAVGVAQPKPLTPKRIKGSEAIADAATATTSCCKRYTIQAALDPLPLPSALCALSSSLCPLSNAQLMRAAQTHTHPQPHTLTGKHTDSRHTHSHHVADNPNFRLIKLSNI